MQECLMQALVEQDAVFVKLLLDFEAFPYLVCVLSWFVSFILARFDGLQMCVIRDLRRDRSDSYQSFWRDARWSL